MKQRAPRFKVTHHFNWLHCFLDQAFENPSTVLLHTVSLTVEPTQRNRSGWQEVDRMSVGIVAGGESEARWPGESAYIHLSSPRVGVSHDTIHESTESCLQVYLPWLKAETQLFKIWRVVGFREQHRGQRGFDWISIELSWVALGGCQNQRGTQKTSTLREAQIWYDSKQDNQIPA